MSPTNDTSHELVHIISLSGDEHDKAVESTGQDPATLVEHLSRWDYGEETDGATSVLGHTDRRDVEHRWTHPYHVIKHGALTYWLIADHPLRLLSLYRRPLDAPEQESAIEQLAPMIKDLSGPNPWVPGVHFHNHPGLAQRLHRLIAENAEWLVSGDRDHRNERTWYTCVDCDSGDMTEEAARWHESHEGHVIEEIDNEDEETQP